MTDTRYRALNSLRRHYGSGSTLQSDSDLLRWAATLTDAELLAWSNLGKRSLRWIRDHADGLPPEKLSLDAAWAEAEAALPEGWAIVQLSRLEPDFIALHDDWEAVAIHPDYLAFRSEFGHGPTPPAALRDLRSNLVKRTEP